MTVAWILKQKGRNVISALPGTPVEHAISLLEKHNIGAVVIVDEQHRVQGIVSERDIVRILATQGPAVLSEPVAGTHDAERGRLHGAQQHRLAYGADDVTPLPPHSGGRERPAGGDRFNRRRGEAQARDGGIRGSPDAAVFRCWVERLHSGAGRRPAAGQAGIHLRAYTARANVDSRRRACEKIGEPVEIGATASSPRRRGPI